MSDAAFTRMQADHLAVLYDALGDVKLSDNEHRMVRWLAGMDRPTVAAFAEVFRKARGAARTGVRPGRERALIATLRGRVAEADAEIAELRRTRVHLEARVAKLDDDCRALTAALRGEPS